MQILNVEKTLFNYCLIIVGVGTTLYVGLCLLLFWGQNRLIFFPDSQVKSTPEKYQLDYEDVWINSDREKIHGWWIPAAKESAPAVMYFHGNASNNGDVVDNAAVFHNLGLSTLLVDYRGYGKSSPTFPNETIVYKDAAAAWQYLTKTRELKPKNIFVYGHSLGGAIAINLATQQPDMAGLIVEGTFTSIRAMSSLNPWFKLLPLDLIVNQRFDSINKIAAIKMPLLIFHGTDDEIIPAQMAQQLYEKALQPKELVFVPKAEHDNVHKVGSLEYILNLKQFIRENSQ